MPECPKDLEVERMVRFVALALGIGLAVAIVLLPGAASLGDEQKCSNLEIDAEKIVCCNTVGRMDCVSVLGAPRR